MVAHVDFPWSKGPLAPFLNLTIEARVLQIFRFITTILSLLVMLVALIGPVFSAKFYISRINCSHLDVSKGIYESLRNSVSESSIMGNSELNGQLPVDSSLTNSEISILSQYAEEQVANSPQYYVVSLWAQCIGDYDTTQEMIHGKVEYIKHNEKLTCSKSSNLGEIFNYQQALKNNGMESVLAYAYQGSLNDKSYAELAKTRFRKYAIVPILLILTVVLTGGLLLFQYVLYSNKGDAKDLSSLPRFLLHIVSALTVVNFLAMAIGGGMVTSLLTEVRYDLQQNLGSFGITLTLGAVWFSLIWTSTGCSTLLMFSWILPTWCSNPPEEDEFENYNYQRAGDFRNRNISRGTQIFRQKSQRSQKSNHSHNSDDLESTISNDSKPRDKLLYATSEEDYNTGSDDDDSDDDDDNYDKFGNDKTFFNYQDKQENKLRKLGESLSRKSSVRHLNSKLSRKPTTKSLSSLKEHELTAQQALQVVNEQSYSPMPHHYRVDTFDGFQETNRNRSTTRTKRHYGDYNPFESGIELKDLTK